MSDQPTPADAPDGGAAEADGPAPQAATTPAPPPSGTATLGDTLRTVAIAASVGAAVIHFALTPAHLDERTRDGVFFLVVAWLQVGAALALVRWRDRREPLLAAAAVNGAVALVWLGSRTIGVPETHHSTTGFPDALSGALEVTVVLAAALALAGSTARRSVPRLHPVVVGVGGLALVGLVSASVTPSMAGEDDGPRHGDVAGAHDMEGMEQGHDGQAVQQAAASDRCDLGFNTPAFNEAAVPGQPHVQDDDTPVDFTLEEWAEVFVDPNSGASVDAVVGYLNDNPVQRDGILSGGLTHTLDPDPWNPLTDEAECDRLASELEDAKGVAAAHPTVADAEAAGYVKVTGYLPGIAAHYINYGNIDGDFELEKPEMLLYDGTEQDSNIVGLSYYLFKDGDEEPTDGFTGDNDHYHRHTGLCFRDGVVVAGSNSTEAECAAAGGRKADGAGGWMSHVWIVPGCESDWGVFSGANPSLSIRTGAGAWDSGCGTGKTLDDPLAFETDGRGPSV
jgi:hypothetical protein